jgi:glycosyltransferase involved in cell wall biosynthesis
MTVESQLGSISAVLHYTDNLPYSDENFIKSAKSISNQFGYKVKLIILDSSKEAKAENLITQNFQNVADILVIKEDFDTLGLKINTAAMQVNSDYFLYIDNQSAEIQMKNSATSVFMLAAERNPDAGFLYVDYELKSEQDIKEIKLLKHHIGRVRDNQDYGRVFFIKKDAFNKINGCGDKIQFNTLYDLRLKLSEIGHPIHISNRYSGSFYSVIAEGKGHNVFDYLMASKESQLEAEDVLSKHLKRINAYLEPGKHYQNQPLAKNKSLKATVIIPVNNRADFIETAIESILAQTVQDIEVIVMINGGKDDPTIAKVNEYMEGGSKYNAAKPKVRCEILDINNIGTCLNVGAKLANGEYYVQLDSDDRLKPDAVRKILDVFESDSKIGIVIGSYEVWEKDDKGNISKVESIPVVTHDEWTEDNGRNNLLRINGAGAPRSIPIQLIKDIGYFGINDEPFARNYGEDYEMVLKISEKHRVGRVWDPIYDVVRHSGGTDHNIDQATIDRNDEAKDYMREEAIKRRQKLNS